MKTLEEALEEKIAKQARTKKDSAELTLEQALEEKLTKSNLPPPDDGDKPPPPPLGEDTPQDAPTGSVGENIARLALDRYTPSTLAGRSEIALNMGSAAVGGTLKAVTDVAMATPFAYAMRTLSDKLGFEAADPERVAEVGNKVEKMLTFEPRTKLGKEFKQGAEDLLTGAIQGTPYAEESLQFIAKQADDWKSYVLEKTGSPVMAEAAVSAPELALTVLGGAAVPVRSSKVLAQNKSPSEYELRNNYVESDVEIEQIEELTKRAYAELDEDEYRLKPKVLKSGLDFIEAKLGEDLAMTPEISAQIKQARKNIKSFGDGRIMSLENLKKAIYSKAGDSQDKLWAAGKAKRYIDEYIGALQPRDFVNGEKAGNELKKRLNTGRELSKRIIRARAINNLFYNASLETGREIEVSVDGLRNLIKKGQAGNIRGMLSKDEINNIENIVRGNVQPEYALVRGIGALGIDIATLPVNTVRALRVFGDSKYRQMRLIAPTKTISEKVAGKAKTYEQAFKGLEKQVLSGAKSDEVIERYLKAIPVDKRSGAELGELLVLADADLDALDIKGNKLQREALEYARGVRAIRGALATGAVQSGQALATPQEEEENVTIQ